MEEDPDVQKAVALITSLPLSPQEHRLLSCFVKDAVHPKAAALYVLQRASNSNTSDAHMEPELYRLLEEWKQLVKRFTSPTKVSAATKSLVLTRDNGRCCITGRPRVWWDIFGWSQTIPVRIVPTEVVANLDDPSFASLREILAVFITESQLLRLVDNLNMRADDESQPRNTWTLQHGVAAAFRYARVQIRPDFYDKDPPYDEANSTCRYMMCAGMVRPFTELTTKPGHTFSIQSPVILSTKNPQSMPLPNPFLFDIHARFCNSLRWLQIQHQMLRGWPGSAHWHKFKVVSRKVVNHTVPTLRRLWLWVPSPIRLFTYQLLIKVGVVMYGEQLKWVQRVPFGLYIKHGPGKFVPAGEAPALQLVEQYTDAPAPKLIDLLKTESETYLVMTRLPGVCLQDTINMLSYPEREQLAINLRRCVSQFRQIPNPNHAAICSANGGPLFDYRLGDPAGPFESEEAFNKHIITMPRLKSAIHDHPHKVFLSHADFSPTNILIDRGKLSGIVDFGCAGFYPEYWEYTKGVYGHFGPDKTWPDLMSDTFLGSYEDELAAEQRLWEARIGW